MRNPSRAWAAWRWSLAAALALAIVPAFLPEPRDPEIWAAMRPFIVGGVLIFLVGLVDDVRGLGPAPKLLVEVLAAAIMMAVGIADRTRHGAWATRGRSDGSPGR